LPFKKPAPVFLCRTVRDWVSLEMGTGLAWRVDRRRLSHLVGGFSSQPSSVLPHGADSRLDSDRIARRVGIRQRNLDGYSNLWATRCVVKIIFHPRSTARGVCRKSFARSGEVGLFPCFSWNVFPQLDCADCSHQLDEIGIRGDDWQSVREEFLDLQSAVPFSNRAHKATRAYLCLKDGRQR